MENKKQMPEQTPEQTPLEVAKDVSDLIEFAAKTGTYFVKKAVTPREVQAAIADGEKLIDSAVEEGGQKMDAIAKGQPKRK